MDGCRNYCTFNLKKGDCSIDEYTTISLTRPSAVITDKRLNYRHQSRQQAKKSKQKYFLSRLTNYRQTCLKVSPKGSLKIGCLGQATL